MILTRVIRRGDLIPAVARGEFNGTYADLGRGSERWIRSYPLSDTNDDLRPPIGEIIIVFIIGKLHKTSSINIDHPEIDVSIPV